jgi:hypothetical protein
MTTLIIRDIARHAEMSRTDMSAVRGGTGFVLPLFDSNSFKLSNDAQQLISQSQSTIANTGDNVAFAQKLGANVTPYQSAHNSNTVNVFAPGMMRD